MNSLKTLLVSVSSLLITGCSPLYDPGPQDLQIVFAKFLPGDEDLKILKGNQYIKPVELTLLQNAGLRGRLIIRGEDGDGSGEKVARILIVMFQNVNSTTELRQPDATNGLYLQTTNGFELLPPNTKTITNTFLIEPHHNYSLGDATDLALNQGSIIHRFTGIIWTENWNGIKPDLVKSQK